MTDLNRPPMEVLTGASGVGIGTGNFSNVLGNQYNYHYMIDKAPEETKMKKDLPALGEFHEIKHGDIYKDKDVCYSWQLCSNGKDGTEVAVYTAQISISGTSEEKKFTVKTYRGRNAMKEWRRDFVRCSTNCGDVPLFGYNYNKSSVPILVFHGELVPLVHVEDRVGLLGFYYICLLRSSFGCMANELWMDPVKGKFCRGPVGPECRERYDDYDAIAIPSDVEFLEEDVVIRYFSNMEHDQRLLSVLSYTGHLEITNDDAATNCPHVISASTNSTIAINTEAVRWNNHSEGCLDKGQVMPNGITRFRLIDDRGELVVDCGGEPSVSWLLQASWVFQAHNISLDEDLSCHKLIFPHIRLKGSLEKSKHKRQRRQLYPSIYLCLVPFSILPSARFYSWSFHPTGQNPLSSDMCKYLGLPFDLCSKVYLFQRHWPTKIYKTIRDYQIARGFDPGTTDFARCLGLPVFEIIPAENRFEKIEEEQEFHLLGLFNDRPTDDDVQGDSEVPDQTEFSDPDPAQTALTQQVGTTRMHSLLGALFSPITWEAIEGSGISAVAI